MISLIEASEVGGSVAGGTEGFALKTPEKKAIEGAVAQMDETDEDEGIDLG